MCEEDYVYDFIKKVAVYLAVYCIDRDPYEILREIVYIPPKSYSLDSIQAKAIINECHNSKHNLNKFEMISIQDFLIRRGLKKRPGTVGTLTYGFIKRYKGYMVVNGSINMGIEREHSCIRGHASQLISNGYYRSDSLNGLTDMAREECKFILRQEIIQDYLYIKDFLKK